MKRGAEVACSEWIGGLRAEVSKLRNHPITLAYTEGEEEGELSVL